jgi:hypothetical protein
MRDVFVRDTLSIYQDLELIESVTLIWAMCSDEL